MTELYVINQSFLPCVFVYMDVMSSIRVLLSYSLTQSVQARIVIHFVVVYDTEMCSHKEHKLTWLTLQA